MNHMATDEVLPHGDHVMPDGRINHVLEVQDGVLDAKVLFERVDLYIEKTIKEAEHGQMGK
jgi:hypothetical protein